LVDRSNQTLHELVTQISENQNPILREVEVLYYFVQILQALYFFKKKQIIYLALDHLKQIQVFDDSSVKLHDFNSSLKFVTIAGEKEGTA
jgi:hypothetical protein